MTNVPGPGPGGGYGPSGPPGPDPTDLRLLAELARGGEAPIPQLAWAVGISQIDAAARLARLSEAGLPMRVLAQCDSNLVYQFLAARTGAPQFGPVGPQGHPYPGPQVVGQVGSYGPPPGSGPQFQAYPPGQQPVGPATGGQQFGPVTGGQQFVQAPSVEPEFSGPIGRPVTPAPSEQDVAEPTSSDGLSTVASGIDPAAMWGIPGTASWTERGGEPERTAEGQGSAPTSQHQHAVSQVDVSQVDVSLVDVPRATSVATQAAATAESAHATITTELRTYGGLPPIGTRQEVVGLSGERVAVTVTEVIDPGNEIMAEAGYRLDSTERAVLVRTVLSNAGPASHDAMPDLYLFLVDSHDKTLPKAPVALGCRPSHRVGVPPGAEAEGWTIFLIDADAAVVGVRWCVRPDLVDRTLTWAV